MRIKRTFVGRVWSKLRWNDSESKIFLHHIWISK